MKPLRVHRRLLLALGCAALLVAAGAQAQALGAVRESAVKAAYLYKFGSFVEWPPGTFRSPAARLVIGVYGDDAVASELEQIAQGREVEGHPVRVLRVRERDDLAWRCTSCLPAARARAARANCWPLHAARC